MLEYKLDASITMKVNLFRTLHLFLISSSVYSQQYKTAFKVGVAAAADPLNSGECTEEESKFIEQKLQQYTIDVARMYFRDETLKLDDQLIPLDETHFDEAAFEDFNVFEARKAMMGTGEDIPLNTIPPDMTAFPSVSSSAFPSITPSDSPSTHRSNSPSTSPVTSPKSSFFSTSFKNLASIVNGAAATAAPKAVTQGPRPILLTCSSKKEKDVCVRVNFDTLPDGTPVEKGQYISDEWWGAYGMKVSVEGFGADGSAPGLNQARIFDSSKPGAQHHFGTPNIMCLGGGPGSGAGGEPGEDGENCSPLGNALIIQNGFEESPQPTSQGGYFTFTFEKPVELKSLQLMGITQRKASFIETVDKKGKISGRKECKDLGENSVQEIKLDRKDAVKAIVYVTEAAAVTQLDFCVPLCEVPSSGIGEKKRTRNMSLEASQDTPSQDKSQLRKAKLHQANRDLIWNFRQHAFRWGGYGSFTCYLCNPEVIDARRSLRRSLQWDNAFLISAFESMMSLTLTNDLSKAWKDYLDKKKGKGCLGSGDLLSVVFQFDMENIGIE